MDEPTPATRAKRLLPLFDDAAPIVCTLDAADRADRLALIERLRAAATSIERTETGLLLHFARTDEIESDVRRFAVDEKRCCAFWGFAVLGDADELALRWDGPPSVTSILDTLDAALHSDEPLESIAGLL